MSRGFEENIPKVRPRVRLGRMLDEQVAEAKEVAAAESVAPALPETEPTPPAPVPVAAPAPRR
jgi:hypothetical protein